MANRVRHLVAPVYLFACLLLGGSAQGIWQNMALQLGGVAIVAWAALERNREPLPRSARQLFLLIVVSIGVIGLQTVPLPPAIWVNAGGRERIAEGYAILGTGLPWQPLSLAPAETLDALLKLIPPIAMLCAMVCLKAYRPITLVAALVIGAAANIVLGIAQVTSADPTASGFYLYNDTNWGRAVGFFANADHLGILLVICLPFVAAAAASVTKANVQRYSAALVIAAGAGLVLIVGLALNGSLAGYGLGFAAAVASLLLVLPQRSKFRQAVIIASLLVSIAAISALQMTNFGSQSLRPHATSAVGSRADQLAITFRAIAEFLPFGSGLGSFQSIYPLYEELSKVTPIYVVHVHNDYAELVLELGVAGLIIMVLFFVWWIVAVSRAWHGPSAKPFVQAAAIASAAILLHSLVDFPLRTAAISASFAMCLSLLAETRFAPCHVEDAELRQSRHVEIS